MYANYLDIVSVKRLVLSGHKPVPDLSLTNIFVTIWRNLGDNDFNALVTSNDIHYNGFIMGAMASQITSLTIVYSTFYSDAYQRKHQSSASLAFVRVIQLWPVNSPHKWPVTRKMFPFDDVIMS